MLGNDNSVWAPDNVSYENWAKLVDPIKLLISGESNHNFTAVSNVSVKYIGGVCVFLKYMIVTISQPILLTF